MLLAMLLAILAEIQQYFLEILLIIQQYCWQFVDESATLAAILLESL